MGKIADASGKYAQESKAASLAGLIRVDLEVLLNYNRKTGHLLNYDSTTGRMGNCSMEVLRNRGIIQRLMDNKLIFPGGKLTPKGLQECERLQQLMPTRTASVPESDLSIEKSADRTEADLLPKPIAVQDRTGPKLPISEPPPEPPAEAKPDSAGRPRPKEAPVSKPLPKAVTIAGPPAKVRAAVQPPVNGPSALKQPLQQKPVTADGEDKAVTIDDLHAAGMPAPKVKKTGKPAEIKKLPVKVPGAEFDENSIDDNIISLRDPQSAEAEQFKILRTNILFPVTGSAPQSILITGALPGDGKSFVSANLAVSIAMNINKHVLLIDCDLRKPDIHRMFGFGELPGLSEYLMEHQDLDSLLIKPGVDKLTLLPGGSVPTNPSELMSTERMSELLEEVKIRYHDRLIVLDSPPPALAAETVFLARYVDGVVLVVKQGSTPRQEVVDMMNSMGSEKIIGCVINHLDVQVSSYYGRKKYSKYGKRYYK